MKNYKVYGNDHTHLILTDKSRHFYSGEEMEIREYEIRDIDLETDRLASTYEYSYIWAYGSESPRMSENELNAELEELADQNAAFDAEEDEG